MPRPGRNTVGGVVYHVINRGNGRANVFHKEADQVAFLRVLSLACERHSMRLLGWCLMTNHFHLVLWPRRKGDLSKFMQWLTTCHVRRYHRHYGGGGHVWQGRFRSFPVEPGPHLLTVLRYVERNPVRAGMVKKAQDWQFSSAMYAGSGSFSRSGKVPDPLSGTQFRQTAPSHTLTDLELQRAKPIESWLEGGPCERPAPWLRFVNRAGNSDQEADQLARIRESVNRGSPLGEDAWRARMAKKLGLEASIRPRGRPRKNSGAKAAKK